MSHFITANTPDGRVVREIFPTGERAYRISRDGRQVSYCPDHKGPWLVCNWFDIPTEVQERLCPREAMEAN